MTGASKLPIPVAALAQHSIVLGKTRAGKSSKLRVLVEHLLEHDKPVCIIDPKGDWWGLKSSADGKRPGYPVVIFGGEHADVPINRHSGPHVAELIATGNRPAIIDLGGWMVAERTEFFIAFASHLFKLTKGARYLVVDEVHNFCPKGKIMDPNAGRMLHWANRLASEGAGKGITLMAASQRPQKVHNDFLTSCETLIACKVIHKSDRDAIKDWIDGCADPTIGKEVLAGLAQLKRPEAWVWSPEAEFGPQLVEFPLFSTYDSFAVQKANAAKLKGWASVDLDEVRAKLEAVVKEAEANDPAELKRQLADARRQLQASQRAPATPARASVSREDLQAAEQRGYGKGAAAAHKDLVRNVRAIRVGMIGAVQAATGSLNAQLRARVEELVVEPPAPTAPEAAPVDNPTPRSGLVDTPPRQPNPTRAPTRQLAAADLNGDRPPVQQRILDAVAELEQLGAAAPPRQLVAFMANYSNLGSKGFRNALSALSSEGMIEYQGESILLTADGRTAANPPERPRTSEELQERVIQMLGGASGRILQPLIEAYPNPIEREEVARSAGYGNLGSKGFRNAISRLRTLGFIDYRGSADLVAKPVLFLEGG